MWRNKSAEKKRRKNADVDGRLCWWGERKTKYVVKKRDRKAPGAALLRGLRRDSFILVSQRAVDSPKH